MGYYLEENKPLRTQFGRRQGRYSGVQVIHTAESKRQPLESDRGAYNVANFIRRRSTAGSYHVLVDSQNVLELVDPALSAWHVRGYNSTTVGLSVACEAALWATYPEDWVHAALTNLARAAYRINEWAVRKGLPDTPPVLLTLADVKAGRRGFTSHAALDPSRRTDPGRTFPWQEFLRIYGHYKLNGVTPMPPSNEYDQPNDHSRALQIAVNGAAIALGYSGELVTVDGYVGPATVQLARMVESRVKEVPNQPQDMVLPYHLAAVEAIEAIKGAVQQLPQNHTR